VGCERFLLTYGDGVTDLDISDTVRKHADSGALLSITAYKPSGKFGALDIDMDSGRVRSFLEKPAGDGNWINAGYFVCEPELFDYLPENDPMCIFERLPLETIAAEGKMQAYRHTGFWKPMDTMRDNFELNEMWNNGNAPWKIW
jgi:glucose-1-phosphate cytidylyltransferase